MKKLLLSILLILSVVSFNIYAETDVNNRIKKIVFTINKDGKKLTVEYLFEYNNKGDLVKSVFYDVDGSIIKTSKYYFDKDFLLTKEYNGNNEFILKNKSYFGKNGNIIESIEQDSYDKITKKTKIFYNSKNCKIKEIEYNPDNEILNYYYFVSDNNCKLKSIKFQTKDHITKYYTDYYYYKNKKKSFKMTFFDKNTATGKYFYEKGIISERTKKIMFSTNF